MIVLVDDHDDLRIGDLHLVPGVGKLRFFRNGRQNDEDNQQNQQHVGERRDVDRRHYFFTVLSCGYRHAASLRYDVTKPTSSKPACFAASRIRMMRPYGALASATIETCRSPRRCSTSAISL